MPQGNHYGYYLLFKTAQAEFRAWKNIAVQYRKRIFPVVELTRGRKIRGSGAGIPEEIWFRTPGIYNFDANVRAVAEAFGDHPSISLDLTRETKLSCYEIEELTRSYGGYRAWVNFVAAVSPNFNKVSPVLIVNPEPDENEEMYIQNIEGQFDSFANQVDSITYRASVVEDVGFLVDIEILSSKINEFCGRGGEFIVILDHEFIRPGTGILHAARTLEFVRKITEIVPEATLVVMSTSFPKFIEDIGNPEHDTFPQEERFLYNEIIRNTNLPEKIRYGDYGSINPIRNDDIFTTAWRPRIDFPVDGRTYYYREKKAKENSYSDHYVSVARKVVGDANYSPVPNSWGVKQVEAAAHGQPPGKSPGFWISVRMEIHIRRQIERFGIQAI